MKQLYTTSSYINGDHVTIVENALNEKVKTDNVTASFMIGIYKNKVVFAYNQNRGIEIPGGHVEKGETVESAAVREMTEETGCIVESPIHIVRITHECYFEKPEGYKYPFPTSYMEFFVADVIDIDEYVENDECKAPIFIEFDKRNNSFCPILTDEQIPLWDTFCEKNNYVLWILQQALEYKENNK